MLSRAKINIEGTNMKKRYFNFILCLLFVIVSLETTHACSFSDLKKCDRAGLVSLIKEVILQKSLLNFKATEIVSNNFPESIEFWTQANCPDQGLNWPYYVPNGYRAVSCSYGEMGSHGGCSNCIMTKIKLEKEKKYPIVYSDDHLGFRIAYNMSDINNRPKEINKNSLMRDEEYGLLLKKYDFPDYYISTDFSILINTDKDVVKNCDKAYVRAPKYVGEQTKNQLDYGLPLFITVNGVTLYSEYSIDSDMMGTKERISYKRLYDNKCYMVTMSTSFSSYPQKSDIAYDKNRMKMVSDGVEKRMNEVAIEFIDVVKGFEITEKELLDLGNEDLKKMLGAESIVNRTVNCIDFTISEDDFHDKRTKYEIFSDYELTLEEPYDDYILYNDMTEFNKTIFDDYLGFCKKSYFNSIFSEQFFINKFVNISKIPNLEDLFKKYNKSNNNLSPEQMTFLIVAKNILMLDGFDRENYLTNRFREEIKKCSIVGCLANLEMAAQDYPASFYTPKIGKAIIQDNKAVVNVFFRDGLKKFNFIFEDNNWRLDLTE